MGQVLDGPGEQEDPVVGKVLGQGLVKGQIDQVEHSSLPLGQAGKEAVRDQPAEGGGDGFLQAAVDRLGQGLVGGSFQNGVQGDLLHARGEKVEGIDLLPETLSDAGEKAGEGAVIQHRAWGPGGHQNLLSGGEKGELFVGRGQSGGLQEGQGPQDPCRGNPEGGGHFAGAGDEILGPLQNHPQLAQGGVIQRPPPPGGENPPGTDHPDARDPQEGVIIRGVDLHGKVFQVGHGPAAFGVQLGV